MLLHWIWFAELKDISLLHKHRLLERFGDPEELYRMSEEALLQADLPEKERNALTDKDLWKAEQIAERCAKRDIGVLPVLDSAYPKRLRNSLFHFLLFHFLVSPFGAAIQPPPSPS